MDFSEAFSDCDAPADVLAEDVSEPEEPAVIDFLAGFSDGEESEARPELLEVMPSSTAGPEQQVARLGHDEGHISKKCRRRPAPSMVGKVGQGRHGGDFERALVCAHMRAQKQAKRAAMDAEMIAEALQNTSLVKAGSTFNLEVKPHASAPGGIKIFLQKARSKGNRFVRKIPFVKFIKASFGQNTSNIALATLLGVDSSTIPRLQKSCAGVFMAQQARVVAKL